MVESLKIERLIQKSLNSKLLIMLMLREYYVCLDFLHSKNGSYGLG